MRRLARGVKMSPSGLRLAFRAEFGRTPRDYQAALRLLSAIKEVASGKIEAVALVIGYRSKKDFYRMFRSLTGLTPTNFRSLSQDEQRKLISKAWRDVQGFSIASGGSKVPLLPA
jgi:methylphosphotriester-DNA--protein-cysteine methyltransferase